MNFAQRTNDRHTTLRLFAGAVLALGLFSGGTCQVSYCSDDCDPCIDVCKCHHTCSHGLASDPVELFALTRYVLVVGTLDDGSWSRSYRSIVGPSVERAFGPQADSRRVVELFARNVVQANARLFGAQEHWSLIDVERSDAGVLVRFERADGGASTLTLLLDARGRLLEIEHQGRL